MTPIVVAIVVALGTLVLGYRLRRSASKTKVDRVAHSTLDAKPLEDLQPQVWISRGNVVLNARFESFAHLPLAPEPTAYIADISDIAATALIEFNSLIPIEVDDHRSAISDVERPSSATTSDSAIFSLGEAPRAISLREQGQAPAVTSDSTLFVLDEDVIEEVELPVFIDSSMAAFVRSAAHTSPQGDSTLFNLDDVEGAPTTTDDASLLIFIDSRMTQGGRADDLDITSLPARPPEQSTLIFVDDAQTSDLSMPIYVGGELDDEHYAPCEGNSVLFKIPEPTHDSSIIEIPVYLGGDVDGAPAQVSAFAHNDRYSHDSIAALDAHLRLGNRMDSGNNALVFPEHPEDSDEFYALPDSFQLPMTTPSDPFAPMPPLPDYMRDALKETAAAQPSDPPQLRVVPSPNTPSPRPRALAQASLDQAEMDTPSFDPSDTLRQEMDDFFSYRRDDVSEVNIVPFSANDREDTKEAPAPVLDELLTLDATHSQRIYEALLSHPEVRALPLHRQDEARAALRRLVALPQVQTFFAQAFRTQIILDVDQGFVYEPQRLPVSSSRRLSFFRWLSSIKISHIYLQAMIQLVEETFEPSPDAKQDDPSTAHELYAAHARSR